MLRLVVLELRETVPIMESSHTELSHMKDRSRTTLWNDWVLKSRYPHMPIKRQIDRQLPTKVRW